MNWLTEKENTIFGHSFSNVVFYTTQVVGVFLITFIFLYILGFIPEQFKSNDISGDSSDSAETLHYGGGSQSKEYDLGSVNYGQVTKTTPRRITIDKIGVDSIVEHPDAQDIETLDNSLKKGAVYYPGSGTIEDGNVFLFGHSTNWKVLNNQAYKTFNDLDKLKFGDEITLHSGGVTYIYSVEKVTLANADTAFVDFTKTGRRLTLSTCNTFGAKQERWVVDAVFKEKRSI